MTKLRADSILLFVAFLWGVTFLLIKNEFVHIGPMALIFWRFLMATVILGICFHKNLRKTNGKTIVVGSVIGLFLGFAYLFQTYGMQFTSSGKAGFLTATYVVLVPIFSSVIFKRYPSLRSLMGVLVVFTGMGLLCLNNDFSMNHGELWVLGCALWCALQVVFLGHYTKEPWKMDAGVLTFMQIFTTCVVAGIGTYVMEDFKIDYPARTWGVISFLAIVCTALLFFLQSYAQRYTTATRAAIMFMGEPVFAALVGWYFADELLTGRQLFGCFLILFGMLIAELGFAPITKLVSLNQTRKSSF